jgi:hypothetical protein
MITANKTRRVYQATTNKGIVETYSTVRADREYNFAVVVENRPVKEVRNIEVQSFRYVPCAESVNGMKQIPHICYRTETDYLDKADGRGERVLSFHTTEALARKALETRRGKDIFNAYIVRTLRTK